MKLFSRAGSFFLPVMLCCIVVLRAADENPAAAKKPLPSAKEVLERYTRAIGGKEAFMTHKSQHAIGTVEMPAQQAKGKMDVYAARPNKLLMKMNMEGIGAFNTGYDGKVAWMSTALTGPMVLEGKMRDEVATQADFDQALHDPEHYKSMEMLGVEKFNGEECYKLRLVHRTGFESTEYFSVNTGLQRGFVATQESPLGPVKATTEVIEYKQFGKVFLPSRISQKTIGMETIMSIETMEFDHVDPSVFELPAEVKAMLEKPAGENKPATPRPKNKSETQE